jgi:glycosyltransferase involved in cell wall biosynthesis
MKNNVVFWTQAYNAEKTVARAIESVLNQTCGDFVYYILDHASTDATGGIIRQYAAKDRRIVPLYESINQTGVVKKYIPLFLSSVGENGYLAWLDADDDYKTEFLEKMLSFVTLNRLDMAMCGTEYVDADGTSRQDTPSKTLVFTGRGFVEHIPVYYKYTTRMWAALHRLSLFASGCDSLDFKKGSLSTNFNDCMITLYELREARRAGLLAESLHKYYQSPAQLSAKYTPKWFWWMNEMQARLRDFMLSYGPVSKENENFLRVRFLIWLKYILPRLQNADAPLETRMNDLSDIFSDKKVLELLSLDWSEIGIHSDKAEFLRETRDWALAQIQGDGANTASAQKLIDLINGSLDKI